MESLRGIIGIISLVLVIAAVDAKSIVKAVPQGQKPLNYASFIITPPQRNRRPTILVEEQDRFEFPDQRIRVRIFGPDSLVQRTQERPVENVKAETGQDESTTQTSTEPVVQTKSSLNVVSVESLDNHIDCQDDLDDEYEIIAVARNRFVEAGSVFWFREDEAVYVADAMGGSVLRYKPLKPDDAEASPTTPSPSTPATSTTNDNIESETATKQPSNEASVITETINHPDASTENETGADVDTLEIQEGTNDNATSDETVPSIEKMIWEQALDLKKSRDLDDDLYELYVENEIRLSPSEFGTLTPVVPRHLDESGVTLSVGFDDKLYHDKEWSLVGDPGASELSFNFNASFQHPFQYHKLSFAKTDPVGRVITASVDIRSKLDTYPCQDHLLIETGTLESRQIHFEEAKSEDLVCRPAGVEFLTRDNQTYMMYIDEKTRNLIKFEYDTSLASLGKFHLIAHHADKGDNGRPTGIIIDKDQNLWVAFSGTGELMSISLEGMEVLKTVKIPNTTEIVDLTLDEISGDIWILSDKSLLKMKRRPPKEEVE